MKAHILSEGSATMGLGHLYRCLSYSQQLSELRFHVQWTVSGDNVAHSFLEEQSQEGVVAPWTDDPEGPEFSAVDLLVVDSYHASPLLLEKIAASAKTRIWIDDGGRIDYPPGHVVCSTPGVEQACIRDGTNGRHLLSGFEFHPLRIEFRAPASRVLRDHPERILVLLGGTDLRGLTPICIAACRSIYPESHVTAIVPDPARRQFWSSLANDRCDILPSRNASDLRTLMEECDIAICAGGQTLFEAARMGLPTLSIGVAENQRLQMSALERLGTTVQVGWYDNVDLHDRLVRSLRSISPTAVREVMSSAGTRTFDGLGTLRCITAALGWSSRLRLRPASPADSSAILKISNLPSVREHSLSRESIDSKKHTEWFSRAISDPDMLLLVAMESSGIVVGQVRYSRIGSRAIASISLDPAVRGGGDAPRLLRQSDMLCFERFPAIQAIDAVIAESNSASQNSFLRAGYLAMPDCTGLRAGFLLYRKDRPHD